MHSTNCPVCENPVVICVEKPVAIKQPNYECFKIFCSMSMISLGIFYLVNFAFK